MDRQPCTVYIQNIENEHGGMSPGVIVECEYCGATEQSYGQGEISVRRCFALLAKNCDEDYYYYETDRVTG